MRDYAFAVTWRVGPGGLFDRGRIDASKSQLATRELNNAKLKDGIAAEVGAKDRRRQLLADLATRRVAKLRPQLNIKIHPALKPEPPPR